jgi:hypothetical protein
VNAVTGATVSPAARRFGELGLCGCKGVLADVVEGGGGSKGDKGCLAWWPFWTDLNGVVLSLRAPWSSR